MPQPVKTYRAYKIVYARKGFMKQYFQVSRQFGTNPKTAIMLAKDDADALVEKFIASEHAHLNADTLHVEPVKPQPSYRAAVDWIANMDEGDTMIVEVVEAMPSVLLAAEIFGLTSTQVATDVVALRHRMKAQTR